MRTSMLALIAAANLGLAIIPAAAIAVNALPTVAPSAAWIGVADLGVGPGGTDSNGKLASGAPGTGVVPAEDGVVYGTGFSGKTTAGGFRRRKGDMVTADASTQVLTVYAAHNDRAWIDSVSLGCEGGTLAKSYQITPDPITGRLGYQFRIQPPADRAGEARLYAIIKPVNGKVRVISIVLTLNGNGALNPTPIYAGYPGALDTNDGSSTTASFLTLFSAQVAAAKHPKYPNVEIVCANGATFVEDRSANLKTDLYTLNHRRITIRREDPKGALCVMTRSDRVFVQMPGVIATHSASAVQVASGSKSDTDPVNNYPTVAGQSYPYVDLAYSGGQPSFTQFGWVKHPTTGEIRCIRSGAAVATGVLRLFLSSAFTQDFPANARLLITGSAYILPLNFVSIQGFQIDTSRISQIGGCTATDSGSRIWKGRTCFSDGTKLINSDGFAGPYNIVDNGYPTPQAPFSTGTGYYSAKVPVGHGDTLNEYVPCFISTSTALSYGFDGARNTDGAQYVATDQVEFQTPWIISRDYSESDYGRGSHDINYMHASGIAQFGCRIEQRLTAYNRMHRCQALTVASTQLVGTPGTTGSYMLVTFVEDQTQTMMTTDSAAYGCCVHLLTSGGQPVPQWSLISDFDDYVVRKTDYLWDSVAGVNGGVGINGATRTVVINLRPRTQNNIALSITAPNLQPGDTFVVYTIQHPDSYQWNSLSKTTDIPFENLYFQGQRIRGDCIQVLFQNSAQGLVTSSTKTKPGTAGALSVSGKTGTFAGAHGLNIGDFVIATGFADWVSTVNADGVSVQFNTGGTLASTSAYTYAIGFTSAGSTGYFSSQPGLLVDDFIGITEGAQRYAGASIERFINATTAVLGSAINDPATHAQSDQTTWVRWMGGKAAVRTAFVACVLDNDLPTRSPPMTNGFIGPSIISPCKDFLFLQSTYRPSWPAALLFQINFGGAAIGAVTGTLGAPVEAFSVRDSIMCGGVDGYNSILTYSDGKSVLRLPPQGLTLDNNVYSTDDPNLKDVGLAVDTTGVVVKASGTSIITGSRPTQPQSLAFDYASSKPTNGVSLPPIGIVRPGFPLHGTLSFPGDMNENYLPGLAALYKVGARPDITAA